MTQTPMIEIVASYNALAEELGETTVNRFASREVAVRRHAAIVERYDAKKAAEAPVNNRNGGRPATEGELALDAAEVAQRPERIKAASKPKKASGKAPSTKIILKANKEVRAKLTAACKALGGKRLEPVGFDSYTAFLAGVPVVDGGARVALIPVGGKGEVWFWVDASGKLLVEKRPAK